SDGPNQKRTNSLGQVRTSSRRSSQPKNPAFVGGPDRESAIRVLAGIAGLRDTLEDRPLTSCCRWGDGRSHPPRHRGRGSGPARPVRACVLSRIADIYELAPAAPEREGIDDRAVDL